MTSFMCRYSDIMLKHTHASELLKHSNLVSDSDSSFTSNSSSSSSLSSSLSSSSPVPIVSACTSLFEFDHLVTAKYFQHRTVTEYYRKASCAPYIPDITIPTLLLSALDDPVVSVEALPLYEVRENPSVILAVTERGGHIGYFERVKIGRSYDADCNKRWIVTPIREFANALVLAHSSSQQSHSVTSRK